MSFPCLKLFSCSLGYLVFNARFSQWPARAWIFWLFAASLASPSIHGVAQVQRPTGLRAQALPHLFRSACWVQYQLSPCLKSSFLRQPHLDRCGSRLLALGESVSCLFFFFFFSFFPFKLWFLCSVRTIMGSEDGESSECMWSCQDSTCLRIRTM